MFLPQIQDKISHLHKKNQENLCDYIPDIRKANIDRIIIWLILVGNQIDAQFLL